MSLRTQTSSERLASHLIKKLDPTPSALDELIAKWNVRRTLERYEILTAVGDPDPHIYFIEKGAVKICYDLDGQEVICEFGYPGESIFDLVSFFSEKPSHFYIQALRETRLLGISKRDLYGCMKGDAGMAKHWQRNMEDLLLNFAHREVDLLADRPDLRYRRLLERKPQLFQHIPKKYIAQYLGMSAETLSRLQNS